MSGNVVAWVFDHFPAQGARDRTLKAVLSEVAEAANRDFESAHPGIKTICTHWGFSRSTVIEALNDLVGDDWLEVTEKGGGRGKATVYRVCRERTETVRESDPSDRQNRPSETDSLQEANSPDPRKKGSDSEEETVQIRDRALSPSPKRSPVTTKPVADAPGPEREELEPEPPNVIAKRICDRFFGWVKKETGHDPPEKWVAVRGIVADALKEGFIEPQIKRALKEIQEQRPRPVSRQTLWHAMQHPGVKNRHAADPDAWLKDGTWL